MKMKKSYSPLYFIGQALKGLWRNGVMSFASVAVLMSCLVVMGGFALLVLNIDVNLDQLRLLNQVVVFAEYDTTPEQLDSVERQIWNLDNVKSVTHVTKDEALKGMMESEEDSEVYSDILGENNPLSDEFIIEYEEVDKISELTFQLNQIDGVRKISQRIDLATQLESIKHGVLMVFIWFLLILMIISVFIIVNTIKLSVFARRHEITVMRYVGATGWFITLPFVIEGIILGIISGGVGYLIEWYAYHYVEKMVASGAMSMISILSYADIGGIVLAGFLGVGIVTGIVGSVVSLGKYLKV
ncbi:MAG: permease-like cell division protein FtsX [Clostridia bacterium]|nr:permease-like cell division protein FtsX [Clostridia bacterium]